MRLAVVIGNLVCTMRHPGLESDKLLLVEMIGRDGQPSRECAVATDSIGAGNGEWVLVVGGSSARRAQNSEGSPVDLSVIGIVDDAMIGNDVIFHK
ncbi:MAG: ethanolamine utilization microcompartment protein EutN [Telmatospirillum sp.]|nr:ethanolamine utilization microcompartment protein EutN [Telmatospirillum sp.]